MAITIYHPTHTSHIDKVRKRLKMDKIADYMKNKAKKRRTRWVKRHLKRGAGGV